MEHLRAGTQKVTIALGSTSAIKLQALKEVWPDAHVVGVKTSSGVPEQPVGKEQTKKGAVNRAYGAVQSARQVGVSELLIGCGIENGMWKEGKHCVDGAAIVFCCGAEEEVLWTDTLRIPKDFEPKGKDGRWAACDDPHIIVTEGKRSRKNFLVEALTRWKNYQ